MIYIYHIPKREGTVKRPIVLLVIFFFCAASGMDMSGIHGNIQIQSAKSVYGAGNVDQVWGRSDLWWAFEEDSSFSSLIQVRAYPAAFGYEPLLGASFAGRGDYLPTGSPAIANQKAPSDQSSTIQIYQAWVRYRFPDFDVRVGRLITNEQRSQHFGNYLDYQPGGFFTLSREGVHNAFEFYKGMGMFLSQVHFGVGDALGNRGFVRFYERVTPVENLRLGFGYKVNIFDFLHYDINQDTLPLRNTIDLSADWQFSPVAAAYAEVSWSHEKGATGPDPLPILAGIDLKPAALIQSFGLPVVLQGLRFEVEYLQDRKASRTAYAGVDRDLLWNIYAEQSWRKRMRFQGGIFAAPTAGHPANVGLGLRFTSDIN